MRDKDLPQSRLLPTAHSSAVVVFNPPHVFFPSYPLGEGFDHLQPNTENCLRLSAVFSPFIVGGPALSLPQRKNTPKLSMKCKQEGWGEQCGPLAYCWLRCQRLLTNGSMPTWRQALSCSTTESITRMSQKTALLGSDDTGLEQAHRWRN